MDVSQCARGNEGTGLHTGCDTALLTELLNSTRATGNATLVQLPRVQGAFATTKGALGVSSHGITGMDLPLQDMRIMLFAWVGDGGGGQACSCNSEEFGKLNHCEY